MPIKFFKEDTNFQLKERIRLKKWINYVIQDEGFIQGDINFIITSDKYLLKINKEYLSHNFYTDIVTFNYCEEPNINGDIFISIDTIKNNSTRFSVSFLEELHRVMIHGILHLIGYDDQSDEEKDAMIQKENFYLERLKNLF
ncbi:MAG: rRNA maturation RNase YbeY [Marinilabiliales bacterium]|nr:MAG: rRNA maturation RNase YbeY [Marinilabiliales bacterium]